MIRKYTKEELKNLKIIHEDSDYVNFLEETNEEIISIGKSWEDVDCIINSDTYEEISIEKFKEKANFYYDTGYGTSYINDDLKIGFKDGTWIERFEYDGREAWKWKRLKRPLEITGETSLFNDYINDMEDIYYVCEEDDE